MSRHLDSPRPRDWQEKEVAGSNRDATRKQNVSFTRPWEASRLVDDLKEMVRARNNLGAVALAQGHWVEAGEHLQKAMELNSLLGSSQEESFALGNLGSLAFKVGRQQEAEELWEKAIAVAEKDANQSGLAKHLNNLGMLYRKQGRPGRAESVLKRAVVIAEKQGYGQRWPIPTCNLV